MLLYTKLEHQETSNKQTDFFSKLYFYKNKREMISEQRALQHEFYTTLGSDIDIDLIADFTVSCTFFVYIVKFLRVPLGTLEIPGPSESSDKEKNHCQW